MFVEGITEIAKLLIALMAIFILGIMVTARVGPLDPWLHKDVAAQYEKEIDVLNHQNFVLQTQLMRVQNQVTEQWTAIAKLGSTVTKFCGPPEAVAPKK